ncbi:MAG: hypothetical protein ACJ8F7_03730 [Gemmataceae bacterium]
MTRRDCLRLVAVGLLTAPLPACFSASHQVNRFPEDMPRAEPSAPQLMWSPYAMVRVPDGSRPTAPQRMADQSPLPERPRLMSGEEVQQASAPPMPPGEEPGALPGSVSRATTLRADVGTADETPLMQALHHFLNHRPDLALNSLQSLDRQSQEVLLQMLPMIVRWSETSAGPADPRQVADDVDQLQSLLLILRPRAALQVEKLCFCRQVRKFGVYEALDERPTFQCGELVEVYGEVRNVSCERHASKDGDYCTHLFTRLEIRDANGRFGMGRDFEKIDLCHTPQYDYFQHFRFRVPPTPGIYTLHLEVSDVPTGRKDRRKMEFEIRE